MNERQPNREALPAVIPLGPGLGTEALPPVWDPDYTRSDHREDPRLAPLMAKLEEGYEILLTSEGFTAYLDMMATFHRYSPKNVLLIMAQRPDAELVASFDDWKHKHGRSVKKGERGIKIFYPMKKWVEEVDEETGEVARELAVVGFGIGSVFDVKQTEGPELPRRPQPSDAFGTSDVTGELDRRLAAYAIGQGLTLESLPMPQWRGIYWPEKGAFGTIAIDRGLPADDGRLKTLAHEIAHHLAGHGKAPLLPIAEREPVAEGAAYVTLKHFGIDADGYTFPYIARYQQSPEAFKRALPQIQRVAGQLIAGIESTPTEPWHMADWL